MTDKLQQEIELLKEQVGALTEERLPEVDRASKRRDRRQVLGGFGMFAVALTVAGTLSASALAGSNTVTSDDIVDNGIYHTDIRDSNVLSADVKNNSLTGADINESTLQIPSSTNRIASGEPSDTTQPALVDTDGGPSPVTTLGSTTFTVATPGFYTLMLAATTSEVSGAMCGDNPTDVGGGITAHIDDDHLPGLGIGPGAASTTAVSGEAWLEAGEHTAKVTYSPESICEEVTAAGTLTITDMHMQVFANR